MPEAPPRPAASLSLAARLALGITALLLVGGLTLALAAFAYGRAAAREAFDRLLVGAANDIASAIAVESGRIVVDLPVSAFELLALAQDDRIAYQVRDVNGSVLTGYRDLPRPPQGAQFYDAVFRGEPARYLRLTRRFAERDEAPVDLRTARQPDQQFDRSRALHRTVDRGVARRDLSTATWSAGSLGQ